MIVVTEGLKILLNIVYFVLLSTVFLVVVSILSIYSCLYIQKSFGSMYLVFFYLKNVLLTRNEWGPPNRKVDTRKYRAEPKSIFEYEPGKSSILEQERPVSIF